MFKPINEFVVKIASRCNLNCSYCYEYNLGDSSWMSQPKQMSDETLAHLGSSIAVHMRSHGLEEVFVSLHGGEALLVGPDKLDQACEILKERVSDAGALHLSLQTNGTLLNSAFAEVIKRHDIAVSISIDGAKRAHDRNRVDHRSAGSYDRVISGVELLKREAPNQLSGLLAVVDLQNPPRETFQALASLGVSAIDFLLPHYHWESPPPRPDEDSIAYGRWYWEVYKAWTSDNYPNVVVRFLSHIVSQLAGGRPLYEAMTLAPVSLVVIATDGGIEAVDSIKSTASELQRSSLNVARNSFDEALGLDMIKIRQSGADQLCKKCQDCEFVRECAGGYFPHRWRPDTGFLNPSIYCDDLFWLLANIRDDLNLRARRN